MGNKSLGVRLTSRFRSNKILASLMASTGVSLINHRWIFIVGCYNSGTTLLEQVLSTHSRISGINEEGVMLTDRLRRPEDFGWRRMWVRCESEMAMPEDSALAAAQRIKKQWSHFYDKSKPFLIEKSISNTPRMIFFEEHFSPAYFIHIVRNGYAVSEGIRRKAHIMVGNPYYEKKRYPISACAEQWRRSLQIVEECRPKVKNLLEITYEDLTERTDIVLKTICEFLQIPPFDPGLEKKEVMVHGQRHLIQNLNPESIGRLSERDIADIEEIGGDYLRKYNYYPSV